ncbi:MAG: DNA polymerase/3'-5' exonuclease PolX [Chloroflexi bacterium]|nr:DNA polymerase/3'-5' exonuclease PolX [Chloroflexota bacterium]
MDNREVAETLERIADILDVLGEIAYKGIAYRRAADQIAHLSEPITEIWKRGELRSIPGVGEAMEKKIAELLSTGRLEYYERLKEKVPMGVLDLLAIPDVGPKTAKLLWEQLGITSVGEAEQAAREGRIRTLPGMGVRSEQKILEGIEWLRRRSGRIPLADAWPVADEILAALAGTPGVVKASAAGSLRRRKSTVGDIDLLVAAVDPEPVMRAFASLPMVAEVSLSGPTKTSVILRNGLQVDLRVPPVERYGSLLQYFTGSKEHNVHLRGLAQEMGLSLSEYGFKRGEEEILCPDEEDVYRTLGLPWIPPELREDRGEIEAAQAGRLPRLVEEADILGDLHAHTDWSDGAASLEVMAEAARRKGYRYLVISDHSRGLGIARGLTAERLREQGAEIQRLNSEYADFALLHGVEVEIRGDGSLDLPDDVLAELDVVIASLHSGLRQPKDEITARVVRAMRNPHVDIIGHPLGRILGQRDETAIDVETLLRVAAETGTALEVNAIPLRLDLDDIHIRRAIGMGVKLAINSDAHNPAGLNAMTYGVATARRGWAEPKHILNTLPADDMRAQLKGGGAQ